MYLVIFVLILIFVYVSLLFILPYYIRRDVRLDLMYFCSIDGDEFFGNSKADLYMSLCRSIKTIRRINKTWDSFPMTNTKSYVDFYRESYCTYPDLDNILAHLIYAYAFGDALIVLATIYEERLYVSPLSKNVCLWYVTENKRLDFSDYPDELADDIRYLFVSVINSEQYTLSPAMVRRYRSYISDKACFSLCEDSDSDETEEIPEDEFVDEWGNIHDVYANYLGVIDGAGIRASDKLTYNQVYKVHFSSVERLYAKHLSNIGLHPSQVIHNLVNKGFLTGAHDLVCELADLGFQSSEELETEKVYLLDRPSFVRDLYTILVNALDLSIYYDIMVEHVIEIDKKNGIFIQEQINALIDKQIELHKEYDKQK